MADYKIIAVRVEHPGTQEQHISSVKLSNGSIETRREVHDFIQLGHRYYYTTGGGRTARVQAETTSSGTRFIRTHPDDTKKDNLLNLPRF